ncbi:MAG TPA: DNA polymerase IV, partial [Polyangiaceae bacterium]|nr:DNA polymerase IV [Polyangiaceae bacterium]
MPSPRSIVHVDMDAFYASVEIRDAPALRGKPVLVGGAKRRGVVLAASYEARVFGAHSAMPMAEAMRLCPQATVVPPRHERYAEVSRKVFAIFERYTPLVEGLSMDEAFLDVTESRSLFGDGAAIARAIKSDVSKELGLTASAGVATSKFVAKVASDLKKPDGLVVVPEDREGVAAFLAPLAIERMWGVGPKTSPRLRALGICTLGDLASCDERVLDDMLGSWGRHVRELARGIDPREVEPDRAAKSVGAEETY